MENFSQKQVLVLGLKPAGAAVCELLRQRHAHVTAVDLEPSAKNLAAANALRQIGVHLQIAPEGPLPNRFDFAVVSSDISPDSPLLKQLEQARTPILSELEFGYRQALCLLIAITGANGKSSTAALLHHLLTHSHFKTALAGADGRPLAALAEQTKNLDFLIAQIDRFQLSWIEYFRPAIAILLNAPPSEGPAGARHQPECQVRLFENQQPFDWAIVQRETLSRLREQDLKIPSKIITFSASDSQADLYLDRGLIISRLPGWTGPLLDLDQSPVRGEHGAENLMAAIAVCRILRVSLEQTIHALKSFVPLPGRFQWLLSRGATQFVNDQHAKNVLALEKSLLSIRSKAHQPNVWLIAGGDDAADDLHDVGPLLAQRVRHAFLLGNAAEKFRAAWSLFTPCSLERSLLEAITKAAQKAAVGDVILFSPACSKLAGLQDESIPGELFETALAQLSPSTGGVAAPGVPTDCGPAFFP